MLRIITEEHPAVVHQEQVPAMPGHVFELSQAADGSQIIQFFNSLAMHKWIGWSYQQVRTPDRRVFEASHAAHRISPGLFRLPAAEAQVHVAEWLHRLCPPEDSPLQTLSFRGQCSQNGRKGAKTGID